MKVIAKKHAVTGNIVKASFNPKMGAKKEVIKQASKEKMKARKCRVRL